MKLNLRIFVMVVLVSISLVGCGQENQAIHERPKVQNNQPVKTTISSHSDMKPEIPKEVSKPYPSAANTCVEEGQHQSTEEEMNALIAKAQNTFDAQPFEQLMSKGKNGEGAGGLPVESNSSIMMFYHTLLPSTSGSSGEVPLIGVGFGIGFNTVNSHGLFWYENGKWQGQPYPQAPEDIAKQRQAVLQNSPFCAGNFIELHQSSDLLAVLYDRGASGTRQGQEVHLLRRENGEWKMLWAPIYEKWQELYEATVQFQDGIKHFIVNRMDPMHPEHKWQERWELQGTQYVKISTTK